MQWLKYAAGVATALALGGSAMAADLPGRAGPMPVSAVPYLNWTGCYFGGQAGGAWSHANDTFVDGHAAIGTESLGFTGSGWIAGQHRMPISIRRKLAAGR